MSVMMTLIRSEATGAAREERAVSVGVIPGDHLRIPARYRHRPLSIADRESSAWWVGESDDAGSALERL